MKKSSYHIIGLMSGTSLDGLDICYAQYFYNGNWSFKILKAVTIPYSKRWVAILKGLVDNSASQIDTIDKDYTRLLSTLVLEFISNYNIELIDAISSHGHTAIHKPEEGLTFQIGNLKILAELTNHTCVCDFRTQDVDLGGQGAPLVPVGDKLLFNKYDFCINLGGFSNISFSKLNKLIAFDICPLNIILNYYSKKLGHDYDYLGYLASTGQIIKPLLENLNEVIKRSKEVGISKLLTICTTPESFDRIKKIIITDPMIYGTFGIHPHETEKSHLIDKIINIFFIYKCFPFQLAHNLHFLVAI